MFLMICTRGAKMKTGFVQFWQRSIAEVIKGGTFSPQTIEASGNFFENASTSKFSDCRISAIKRVSRKTQRGKDVKNF
jgi:hypothetical protein